MNYETGTFQVNVSRSKRICWNRETREVRAKVIPNVKRETLQAEILNHVGFNAHVFTDQHVGYDGLGKEYAVKASLISPPRLRRGRKPRLP
jgi:ISXO2-like transposase domain